MEDNQNTTSPSSNPIQSENQEIRDDFQVLFQERNSLILTYLNQIQANVVDPTLKKEGVSNYVTYTIKGQDKNGIFEIIRRFSDFDILRRFLQQRWPSCYIPPIPDKKALGGTDSVFIEERRNQLEFFVQKISELKHLWYSEEFQMFIRGLQSDLEKALSKLPIQTNQDLMQKFQSCFVHLNGKAINASIEGKIESFSQYLRRINSLLENYQEVTKKTIQLREANSKQNELLVTFLLPEYEKSCLTEYVGGIDDKLILAVTTDQKLSQIIQELQQFSARDDLNQLYQLIRQESKEIQAFIECLDSRLSYKDQKESLTKKHRELKSDESKIISGKSSLKSMFSKKSKDESAQEIKILIEQTQADITKIGEIYDIMTIIQGYVEIDRFKVTKLLLSRSQLTR